MGTDIHIYAETKVDDHWASADVWNTEGYVDNPLFTGRDYALFSILADVRNRDGVERLTPIAQPRGIPSDCSGKYNYQTTLENGHSHSYLTLEEILKFDWTQKRTRIVKVDLYNWAQYRDNGGNAVGYSRLTAHPEQQFDQSEFIGAWSYVAHEHGIHPSSRVTDYLDQRLEDNPCLLQNRKSLFTAMCDRLSSRNPRCTIEFEQTYFDAVGPKFWGETIPRLLALGASHENTRICFFFDS